jgi:glutaredoxin-like YruB-family protein
MTTTIYTTPTCGYCKATKEFFKNNNVEYSEVDVTTDTAAAQKIIEKSGQMGVPVITIENEGKEEVIVGFDQAKLSEALGIK